MHVFISVGGLHRVLSRLVITSMNFKYRSTHQLLLMLIKNLKENSN